MAPRARSRPARPSFFCSACGNEQPRWFGRCPACGAWNSALETPAGGAGRGARAGRAGSARWAPAASQREPRPLATIELGDAPRLPTGMRELDRVLGGGLVPGSLLLVGGDPGIGKSTLLLQVAGALAAAGRRVLIAAGEESEEQIRMRAARLGPVPDNLLVLCETDLEALLAATERVRPDILVVDSIQTVSRGDLEGGPGTVTQVRECGLALLHFAKATGTAVFLVGHVTKEGAVAGPRVLEHMVDAVLYLEGERYQHYRVLRAAKNRFGSTHELGVFEMTERGLLEVDNPSAAFLSGNPRPAPGTAVVASLEGTRPLLIEVQALVSSSAYGTPQRVTSGFDARRLAVLLAVLERRVGLRLGRHDVFVSVAGGLTLEEPGTDLGVALAIASSFRNRALLDRTLAIGEVSLSGELRRVARVPARLHEAARLGFTRAGVPRDQAEEGAGAGLEVVGLASVRAAFEALLGARSDVPPDVEDESAEPGEEPARSRSARPPAAQVIRS
jgi:DNA repair protein RadA/Sms